VDGILTYEYNLFLVQRTIIAATDPLAGGEVTIEIETTYVEPRPGGLPRVVLRVNGDEVASGTVPVSAPLLFSADDCLDIGRAYGGGLARVRRSDAVRVRRHDRPRARGVHRADGGVGTVRTVMLAEHACVACPPVSRRPYPASAAP
jgi:hypothetical protein